MSFTLGVVAIGVALVGGVSLLGATRQFPGLAPDPLSRARSLLKRGQLEPAIAEYRAAARIAPDFYGLVELAYAQHLAGDPIGEGEAFERALMLRPRSSGLRVGLGRALAKQGRLEPAAASFDAAMLLEPGNAMAHAGLGEVRLAQGELLLAIAALNRAVELAPGDVAMRDSLGHALLRAGRPEQALEQFETAYRLAPSPQLLDSAQRARVARRAPTGGR